MMLLSAPHRQHPIASVIPPRGVPVRAPLHPGRLLARTCLAPLSLNQSEAARLLGLSRRAVLGGRPGCASFAHEVRRRLQEARDWRLRLCLQTGLGIMDNLPGMRP